MQTKARAAVTHQTEQKVHKKLEPVLLNLDGSMRSIKNSKILDTSKENIADCIKKIDTIKEKYLQEGHEKYEKKLIIPLKTSDNTQNILKSERIDPKSRNLEKTRGKLAYSTYDLHSKKQKLTQKLSTAQISRVYKTPTPKNRRNNAKMMRTQPNSEMKAKNMIISPKAQCKPKTAEKERKIDYMKLMEILQKHIKVCPILAKELDAAFV